MKTKIYLVFIFSILLASCSSLQQSAVNDDIYYSPKDDVVASNETYTNPTYDNTKSTLFGKEYDEKISEILEDDSKEVIDTTIYENEEYENPYESVLVDSYEEAYQRRLDARCSPYYGMNNYFITFSDDYWYASSYIGDPFYNVVIVGDRVWVEPYWITSSFGYGWGYRPSYYWGVGYYYDPFWYSPYYSYYSHYYNPYYYHYHSPYYSNYPYYYNKNYASSSFHSYRQRSLTSRSSVNGITGRSARELPETYMGRNVTRSSTVKSGIDRTSTRTTRSSDAVNTRTATTRDIARSNTSTTRERTATSTRAATTRTNRDYTRSQNTSTYDRSTRSSSTRYNRPSSTSVDRSRSTTGTTRTSTYSPSRSSTSRSGSGSSSVGRSSTRSSGSSSSGSRSSGSSSSSSRSSGSSKSSSSSSRSGGRR